MAGVDVVHLPNGTTYTRRSRGTALERGEHGTLASYQQGCRCLSCARAMRRYWRTWHAVQAVARGAQPQWKVSAARARAHVADLRAAGMSVRSIAQAAQLSELTVLRVQRPATTRIYNSTARAILGVSS